MRFSKQLIAVAVLASTLVLGLPAIVRGDTIFDNLGSGFVSGSGGRLDSTAVSAMPFTVSAGSNLGFTLTSIELPLFVNSATTDQIGLSVFSDKAGQPFQVLETGTLSGITSSEGSLHTASFSGGTFLADGTTYWVVPRTLVPDDFGWNFSIDQTGGSNRALLTAAVWNTGLPGNLGFTVIGTPVTIATVVGLTQDLIVDVVALNLHNGITNNLDAKLDAVVRALDDLNQNNDVAACGALQAFIIVVATQSGNLIPVDDAIALIDATQQIIAPLGCSP